MIIVVVRHYVRPGRYEHARTRIAGNTERMMRQPGILFRHTGDGSSDNTGAEIVTVTGWRSVEDRAAWDALKKARPPEGDLNDFYSGFEVFEVEVFDEQMAVPGT